MQVDHNTTVRIHPAAIATIVDAHERRELRKDRGGKNSFIVGTLMGTADSKLVTVDQAFLVDHQFTEDDQGQTGCMFDFQQHFNMVAMIQAASKETQVIGWFSTSNNVRFDDQDKVLSEFFFNPKGYRTGKTTTYGNSHKAPKPSKPIFLRINAAELREKKKVNTFFPMTAYLPEMFNETVTETDEEKWDLIWTELSTEIGGGAAERTALELMMDTTLPSKEDPSMPSLQADAVGSNLDPLNRLTGNVLEHIDAVQKYIQNKLEAGDDSELDPDTGRMLANILTGVPGLDNETMDKMLNAELTDLLMVTFLTHLAKVQVNLNDKLKMQYGQKSIAARNRAAIGNQTRR